MKPNMDLVGKTLGGFQITAEVGRGGMATVYRAWQPSLSRYVALKVLSPFLQQDPEFVARFQQEAHAAAKLQHPNIVAVYDAGSAGGMSYLVMEFVEGQTLRDLLVQQPGPLDPQTAASIAGQIGSALDYAHSRGVVHRDIKPSNIMITPEGRAVLADFGIARAAGATRLTRTGSMVGTPEYMSPEQVDGERLDHRTDIYSLGVVVYHALTGKVPFGGTTPHSVLYGHVHKTPPPLRQLNPALTPAVEAVVLTALAKNPAQRYQRASEFAAALQAALAGRQPVPVAPAPSPVVPPPSVATPSPSAPPSRRWLVPVLAAVALVVLICAVLYLLRPRSPGTPTVPPPTEVGGLTTPTRAEPDTPQPASPVPEMTATPVPPGDEPPQLTILSPGPSAAVQARELLVVDVEAVDDRGLSAIRMWEDGQLVLEDEVDGVQQVRLSLGWMAPGEAGTYLLELRAVDTAGQLSDRSQVLVSVLAPTVTARPPTATSPPPTTPPTVAPPPTAPPPTAPPPTPTSLPPCSIQVAPRFADSWDRSVLGCPTSGLLRTWAADEFFQNGYMLWREDADTIYVFYHNGNNQHFADTWEENVDIVCRGAAPPPGLYEPCRGFGKVWYEQLGGPGAAIGWATEEEIGFELVVQDFQRGMIFWRDRVGTGVASW